MRWWNGSSWANEKANSGSIQVKTSDFSECLEDDTDKKVDICHATSSGSNPYTENNVSVSSIITGPNGHDDHDDDIIPPFTYIKQGVPGSYPGKNWDAYGQWVYYNGSGCDNEVTPVAPTFTSAVCTGPGTYGNASYTIPSTTGVKYQIRFTNSGSWTDKAAGTYSIGADDYIEVRAVELSGYELEGNDNDWKWTKNFNPPSCTETVIPAAPSFEDGVCTAEGQVGQGSYTIPSTTGVQYYVSINDGAYTVKAAGTYSVNVGTKVEIYADDLPGYDLHGSDDDWNWEDTIGGPNAAKCVLPAVPTAEQEICTGPGTNSQASYTIPSDTGIQYQRWNGATWVNVSAGTVNVDSFPTEVKIRAIAAGGGYVIVPGSITEWTFTFESAGDCLVEATPAEVTFEQPQCVDPGESSEGGYTVPAIPTGVVYTVTLNGSESTGTEGFHALEPGDEVSVVASAAEGYELAEGDWSWGPWTVVSAGDCLEEAPVTAATAVDQTCVVDEQGGGSYVSGWVTIPNSPNVSYFIDGIEAGTGDHPLPPGDYEVTAEAEQGYLLTGYTGPWNLTIEAAEACGDLVVKPLVTPVVTFVQETCEVEGSYTLATEEGEPGAVVWTVSGGLPNTEGTHVVTTAGIVTVTAEPAEDYGFAGETPLLEWSFEFKAAADCDLDTLPLTGGTAAGILGLAGMLLLGGAFLVAARQRRVVVED
jgi:LPXTG-motif cell wall-anchored protein